MRPSRLFHPTRMREVSFIRRWLRARPGGRVCDIGCGDGYYSLRMAEGRELYGFDPWAGQVKQAAHLAATRRARALFLTADARSMPYANGSFDAVLSLCVLEHVPEVERAFHEANRLLKPGGSFLFTVDSLSEPHVPQSYRAYHRERFYIAEFLDVGRVRTLLSENGFEIVQWDSVIRNRVSGAIFRLFALRYATYRWFSPVLSLACWVADLFWGSHDRGYCLLFAARKLG